MYAYSWSKALPAVVFISMLTGCGHDATAPAPQAQPFFQKGWSHNCALRCTNVSVNQAEMMERPGRAGAVTACRESKQACEDGRDAACADALALANNETLYDNCQLVGEGECVEGCTLPR